MLTKSPPVFDIAFNLDESGLLGAGATIKSLLTHCSKPEILRLNFLHLDLNERQQASIGQLLKQLKFEGSYRFIRFEFGEGLAGVPSFFNNYASYGRLFLADKIESSRVLYLDVDLLLTCDVLELQEIDMQGHALGAVNRGTVSSAYDRAYFECKAWPGDTPYFNAGVLLIDLDRWREEDIDQSWKELVRNDGPAMICHDQTILNGVFDGRFFHLPMRYNIPFLPGEPSPARTMGIYHFIGSPKPWDFAGRFLHPGYRDWAAANPDNWQRDGSLSLRRRWRRTWAIRKSILRITAQVFSNRFAHLNNITDE